MNVIRFPVERTPAVRAELERVRHVPFTSLDDLPPMANPRWVQTLVRMIIAGKKV